jgi:hypothetical protein|tara:strand:+ start:310 stop:474 length:165 start_codon:yes stop_codon:yes gene_type:complete
MIVDAIALLLCFSPEDVEQKETYLDHVKYVNIIQVEKKEEIEEECYWVTIDKQT